MNDARRKAYEEWRAAAIEDGMVAYWDCWQASRKQALEDAMVECDKVSFAANTDAEPGYVSSRAGGAVACRNKIKELMNGKS